SECRLSSGASVARPEVLQEPKAGEDEMSFPDFAALYPGLRAETQRPDISIDRYCWRTGNAENLHRQLPLRRREDRGRSRSFAAEFPLQLFDMPAQSLLAGDCETGKFPPAGRRGRTDGIPVQHAQ